MNKKVFILMSVGIVFAIIGIIFGSITIYRFCLLQSLYGRIHENVLKGNYYLKTTVISDDSNSSTEAYYRDGVGKLVAENGVYTWADGEYAYLIDEENKEAYILNIENENLGLVSYDMFAVLVPGYNKSFFERLIIAGNIKNTLKQTKDDGKKCYIIKVNDNNVTRTIWLNEKATPYKGEVVFNNGKIFKYEYNSLIKSVEEEMKEHQKKLKKLNYDENKEKEINKEYDKKILDIYLSPNNYNMGFKLGNYLKKHPINSVNEFMENEYLTEKLYSSHIIMIKKLNLERKNKLEELNKNQDVEMVNNLKKKIELCKNQIKTYEKEKQAAIIAKREEIRNNLLMNNMKNGVLSQYKDRQESNQIIDKKIVNQIHNDYGNAINNGEDKSQQFVQEVLIISGERK